MDKEQFTQQVLAAEQTLYRVAKSMLMNEADCEDAVQDAVIAAYTHLERLQNPAYFKTWATRILLNVCQDMLRARRRVTPVEAVPERGEPDPGQANAEFLALLDSIDEKYRTVLLLYYGEGFSVREISTLLSLKEETVKTRLKRGRSAVRMAYEAE